MESQKVLFLSIKDTKDENLTPWKPIELATLLSWINSLIKGKGILISSPIYECIEFSQVLSSKFSLDLTISRSLTRKVGLNYFDSHKTSTFEQLEIGKLLAPNDPNFINHLENHCNFAIVVIEDEAFSEFHLDCKSRTQGPITLHLYEIKETCQSHQIILKVQNLFDRVFLEKVFGLLANSSERVKKEQEITQRCIEEIPEEIANLCKSVKSPYFSEQNVFTEQLENVSESIEKLSGEIKTVTESISLIQTLSDLYVVQEAKSAHLCIAYFYYEQGKRSWKLKVKNPSPYTYKKIDIYIAETNSMICSFQVIQKNSTIYKNVILPHANYYGSTLVAISENELVAETFTIFPCLFVVDKANNRDMGEPNTEKVQVKLINYSIEPVHSVTFVSNALPSPVHTYNQMLKYGETTRFAIRKNELMNMEIFAIINEEKASNSLAFLDN